MSKRLSSLLVRERVVDVGTMVQAFRRIDSEGGRLGTVLLEMGALDEATLQYYLSEAVGLPPMSPEMLEQIDEPVLALLSVEDVLRLGVIPAVVRGDTLVVVVRDPLEDEAIAEVSRLAKHPIKQHVVTDFRFDHALAELYGVRPAPRTKTLIDKYPAKIGRVGMSGAYAVVAGGPAKILERLGVGWSADQLGRFLAHSEERDDIIEAVLGFLESSFPRRFVMAFVQGKTLRGFAAQGVDTRREEFRATEISAERLLKATRGGALESAVVGVPQDLGLATFYEGLRLVKPSEVACFLLRVGGRPAMALLADNAERPVPRTAVPTAELAAAQGAAALTRLLKQKKQAKTEAQAAAPAPKAMALASLDSGWDMPVGLVRRPAAPPPAHTTEEQGDDDHNDEEVDEALDQVGPRDPTTPSRPSSLAAAEEMRGLASPESADAAGGDSLDDMMFGAIEKMVDEDEGEAQRAGAEEARNSAQTVRLEAVSAPLSATQPLMAAVDPRVKVAISGDGPREQEGFQGPEALIEGLTSNDRDTALKARAELLLAGEGALAALQARFPGPVRTPWPGPEGNQSVGYSGPLLAAVIELGTRFQRQLWALMQTGNRDQRYYAVACVREIRNPESANALGDRLFDADSGVRQLSCEILHTYRDSVHFGAILQRLRRTLVRDDDFQRAAAAGALGRLADEEAIPYLIELVDHRSPDVAQASIAALERLVFDTFGRDKKKWLKWFQKFGRRPRVDWLIEGVENKQSHIRGFVTDALKGMGITFDPTVGRKENKRVIALLEQRRPR